MLPIWRRTAVSSRRLIVSFALAVLGSGSHSAVAAGAAEARSAASNAVASAAGSNLAVRTAEKATATKQLSTRFVIGLERKTEFNVFSLSNPNRVIVELPEMGMQLPLIAGDAPVGIVKSFRVGQAGPARNRVVIDVTSPVIVEKSSVEKTADGRHRLVLDIAATGSTAASPPAAQTPAAKQMRAGAHGVGAGGIQPPMPRAARRPDPQASNLYKPLIVLDPGHGGHDSGAQKYGTVEKEVVLAFSKILRDKLISSNRYRVMMTRDSDKFVELDERRDFAERHKAALFIAIHADYASTSARGATIYSLRDSVADSLKRSQRSSLRERVLTGREQIAPIKAEASGEANAVKSFLADLAQREVDANKDRTGVFAQAVIETMGQSTNLRDNPDKSAAFRVLKTAQVPAVLIELAYVSNQADAKNLRSDQWRAKVTESIMTAIDNYFSDPKTRVPM